MLKFLKKDFLDTNKSLFVLYLVTFISSLIVLISNTYKDRIDTFTATFVLCMGVATLSMIICLILPFVRCFLNNESIFVKDKKKFKYDIKIITIFLTILLSFVIVGISFVNTYSKHSLFKFLEDLINDKHLSKSFLVFFVDSFFKVFILYLSSLICRIMSEKIKNDKIFRTVLYTIILLFVIHNIIAFLIRIIDVERKFVLKIILYIITSVILYFYGKHKYVKLFDE